MNLLNEPFEFISPLPLEDCAERLRKKSEPTRFFSLHNPLKVDIQLLDADGYQFSMRRDAGRNLVVEAVGVLERVEEGTRISGLGRFYRFSLALIFLILVVQFPIFYTFFGATI